MSLSGIYKNTKSLSGVNSITNDISNLYLTTANIFSSNVFTDVANLKLSNLVINSKLSNLITSNLITTGLLNDLSNANVQSNISIVNLQNANVNSNISIVALQNKTQNITAISGMTTHTGNIALQGLTGIGTTSPTFRLDVQGTSSSTNFVRFNNFVPSGTFVTWTQPAGISFLRHLGGESYMRMVSGNTNLSAIEFNTLGQRDGMIYYKHDDSNISNRHMAFYVSNSERVRINNLGNVGIGTTIPTNPLHVVGDINTNSNYRLNGNIVINSTTFGNIQSNITALQNGNVNIQLGNLSAHTQILALQNSNVNLQLGNLSAHTQILGLQNANLNIQAGNLSSHTRITTLETKTQLLSSNAETSIISGNLSISANINVLGRQNYFLGNVGICTSNSIANLHVLGTTYIQGNNLWIGNGIVDTATSKLRLQAGVNSDNSIDFTGNNRLLFRSNTTPTTTLTIDGSNSNVFVGIGSTEPTCSLNIQNNTNFVGKSIDPTRSMIYCFNANSVPSAHSIVCLRTANGSGGNPCLSFDINGVAGWSIFQDNGDSDCLKIKNAWDMASSSAYDCMKIDTSRNVFFYNQVIIRHRFIFFGTIGGSVSYTAGNNINFSQSFMNDLTSSASLSSGVLNLPTGFSGYYRVGFTGRISDGTATQALIPLAQGGVQNLFGSSDGFYWIPVDSGNRRVFNFSTIRFFSSGTNVYARFRENTTIDVCHFTVEYLGTQS